MEKVKRTKPLHITQKKCLTQEEKQKAINALISKVPNLKCPICGNEHFILGDGYFKNTYQYDLSDTILGGIAIPSIPIICNRCGFISQHALGVLGLMFKQENEIQARKEE